MELNEKIENSTNIVESISLKAEQTKLVCSNEYVSAQLIKFQSFVKYGQLYYENIHVNSSSIFIKHLSKQCGCISK